MCSEEARNFSYVYFACLSEKEKRGDKNLIREETGKREREGERSAHLVRKVNCRQQIIGPASSWRARGI